MIDLTKLVPDIYVDESRDFQLYLRLLNIIIGGTKFTIDSIVDIFDPKTCNNRVLDLLCTTFNFNPKIKFTDEDLRIILAGFGGLIRNKGTKKGIEQAISLVFKTQNISSGYQVVIVNSKYNPTQNYYIQIVIPTEINTLYLNELLEYVKPVGYTIEIYLSEEVTASSSIAVLDSYRLVDNSSKSVSVITSPLGQLDRILYSPITSVEKTDEEAEAWNIEHSIRYDEFGNLIPPAPNRWNVEETVDYIKYQIDMIRLNTTTNQWYLDTKYITIPKDKGLTYGGSMIRTEIVGQVDGTIDSDTIYEGDGNG